MRRHRGAEESCRHRAPAPLCRLRTRLVVSFLIIAFNAAAEAAAPADSEPSPKLYCDPNKPLPPPTTPEIIEWSPEEGKYLFPICQFGQLSNQVRHRYTVPQLDQVHHRYTNLM